MQVLDPLFSYRQREARSEYRFLAFWWYRIHDPAHGPREWDLFGFPLVFAGGGGTPQDRYFALFPLFGTIKNFAGFLEAFFVLFPLYYRVDKNITEPESLHNVTPLIGWADGLESWTPVRKNDPKLPGVEPAAVITRVAGVVDGQGPPDVTPHPVRLTMNWTPSAWDVVPLTTKRDVSLAVPGAVGVKV